MHEGTLCLVKVRMMMRKLTGPVGASQLEAVQHAISAVAAHWSCLLCIHTAALRGCPQTLRALGTMLHTAYTAPEAATDRITCACSVASCVVGGCEVSSLRCNMSTCECRRVSTSLQRSRRP